MDPSDTSYRVGPRPKFLHCAVCSKRFKVKPKGVVGMYCSGACKAAAFQMRVRLSRREPKPKEPKPSLEERIAERVVQLLIDRNVVTPVAVPLREPDQE
jgi:hypothetical protein